MPRSEYRSDYSPPRRGGTRVTEYDEYDVRERGPPRKRDYLRDAYDRRDDRSGVVILREEEEDDRRTRGGGRERELREEEVIVAKSGSRDRDRPRRRDVQEEEEDIQIRRRDGRGSGRYRDEEDDIRIRETDRDNAGRYRRDEEDIRVRRRERPGSRDEEDVRVRRRDMPGPREEFRGDFPRPTRDLPYVREEITEEWIHVPRERPFVAREVEEWRYDPRLGRMRRAEDIESSSTRDRERDQPRETVREEVIDIKEREREPPRDYRDEAISVHEHERDRRGNLREEDIRIRERDRGRGSDYHEEEIRIREKDRGRASDYHEEDIRIRERERSPDSPRGIKSEEIKISERGREEDIRISERERVDPRGKARDDSSVTARRDDHEDVKEEEIVIKLKDNEGQGRNEEILIRRRERSLSPAKAPTPPPAPAPPPEPEPIRAPPIHQEIITHHRHIDHGFEPYRMPPVSAPPRIRTPSPSTSPSKSSFEEIAIRHRDSGGRHEDDIVIKSKESREDSRSVVTRRRSASLERERDVEISRRKYIGARPRTESMWTEITKDLVVAEAIESCGYEYEETGTFFYVMEYLRYEDVRHLVQISDEIRTRRRHRAKQLALETKMSPSDKGGVEKISEKIIERPSPSRVVEKEKVKEKIVVIRHER